MNMVYIRFPISEYRSKKYLAERTQSVKVAFNIKNKTQTKDILILHITCCRYTHLISTSITKLINYHKYHHNDGYSIPAHLSYF